MYNRINMEKVILDNREEAFVIIFYIFIIPILLLYFNFIPIELRYLLMTVACILIYSIVKHKQWSPKQLGMSTPDKASIIAYTFSTLIMVIILLFTVHVVHQTPPIDKWWSNPRIVLLFIPPSFLQEFCFRSFLFPLLEKAFTLPTLMILINTLLFAFLHIIYQPLGISISLSLVSGLFFAIMYYVYPNFWLIGISHSLLNLIAVVFGFFLIK